MSDYISKSALIKAIDEQVKGWGKQGIVPSLFSAIAIVQNQPTLDEKEIIRKAFERVVERLEAQAGEFIDLSHRELSNNSITAKKYLNKGFGVARAIEIVKEECGINE